MFVQKPEAEEASTKGGSKETIMVAKCALEGPGMEEDREATGVCWIFSEQFERSIASITVWSGGILQRLLSRRVSHLICISIDHWKHGGQ